MLHSISYYLLYTFRVCNPPKWVLKKMQNTIRKQDKNDGYKESGIRILKGKNHIYRVTWGFDDSTHPHEWMNFEKRRKIGIIEFFSIRRGK